MGGFVDRLQRMWNPPDDEYEDDFEDEDEGIVPEKYEDESSQRRSFSSFTSSMGGLTSRDRGNDSENKIVNINAKAQLQVVLFKPMSFGEETRVVADELIRRHTVVLNLEKAEKDVARRIVDFLSGVAYANNGKIKRIATGTFIITPYNVDLTGDDVLDELEHSGLYF